MRGALLRISVIKKSSDSLVKNFLFSEISKTESQPSEFKKTAFLSVLVCWGAIQVNIRTERMVTSVRVFPRLRLGLQKLTVVRTGITIKAEDSYKHTFVFQTVPY